VRASSHYVVDAVPRPGQRYVRVTRLVPESRKAWTALSANPYFVQYELIGTADRGRTQWLGEYRVQLETLAALVAEDSLEYGLPIARAVPGIVGHVDLTRWGFPQTHWDPGPGFPWDEFLGMVRAALVALPDRDAPAKDTVKVPRLARPSSAPKLIPLWAWSLMKWHDGGKKGTRPRTPLPVKPWYWEWRAWKRGLRKHA
jgi:hypothetical protein